MQRPSYRPCPVRSYHLARSLHHTHSTLAFSHTGNSRRKASCGMHYVVSASHLGQSTIVDSASHSSHLTTAGGTYDTGCQTLPSSSCFPCTIIDIPNDAKILIQSFIEKRLIQWSSFAFVYYQGAACDCVSAGDRSCFPPLLQWRSLYRGCKYYGGDWVGFQPLIEPGLLLAYRESYECYE